MSLSMIPKTLLGMNRRKSSKGQRDLFDGLYVCCLACGRKLTSERSRRRGLGPTCEKRSREAEGEAALASRSAVG